MTMRGKRVWFFAALCVLLLGLASRALAAEEGGSFLEKISWRGPENATVNVCADKDGALCLFLPSMADLSALTLNWDEGLGELLFVGTDGHTAQVKPGDALDLPALFAAGEEYVVTVRRPGTEEEAALAVVHSANQAAMWVESDDPARQGREWVDSAEKGQWNVANGEMLLLNENGDTVYSGDLREIRGRGNSTWTWDLAKRPYQIKLEKKTDLLETNEGNRARTWVLLAEAVDATLLHNQIALNLCKSLGLNGTPEARPVDLYYDGEYRGYYLLCEKAQVNPGRLEIMNYSDYMEQEYPDIANAEAYPRVIDKRADGMRYRYVQNISAKSPATERAYLLELDMLFYVKEASWFELSDDDGMLSPFALKSPEYASKEDVEYVSGLMEELLRAARNNGVDPESGKKLDELLDYDSMARMLLVNFLFRNKDYGGTSTFFYLPEGGERFYAGPAWDFDQSADYFLTEDHQPIVEGNAEIRYWMTRLLSVADFQKRMREIFFQEMVPLLSDTLLGSEINGALQPLDVMEERLRDAWEMNFRRWGSMRDRGRDRAYVTFAENRNLLRDFFTRRLEWMKEDIGGWWDGETFSMPIAISLSYRNADAKNNLRLLFQSCIAPVKIGGIELTEEPDEELPWRRLYTADITVAAAYGGVTLPQTLSCFVNGSPAEILRNDGEICVVRVSFSAPFYKEAMYDGVDYGLLFNYDYYGSQYPEKLEEFGDDPEAVLADYVEYCLPDGVSGIETFDYDAYFERYEERLMSYFAGDIYSCMLYYLENDMPEPMLGAGWYLWPTIAEP